MKYRRGFFLFLFTALSLSLWGCRQESGEPATATGLLLDTVVTVSIYDGPGDRQALAEEALDMCEQWDQVLNSRSGTSLIGQINKNGTGRTEIEDGKVLDILKRSVEYETISEGLFLPTMGNITALWDFDGEDFRLPDDAVIQERRAFLSPGNLHIDGSEVWLEEGCAVDLGGIAKGAIGDLLKEFLIEKGVSSAIINLGGNVTVLGQKPGGSDFVIGVQDPLAEDGAAAGGISIRDRTVATSGTYQRFAEIDGRRYHHIIDPRTGYPAQTDLASATVVCERGMDADALSTVCILKGREQARKFIEGIDGAEGVFIAGDGAVTMTSGMEEMWRSNE